MEKNLYTQRQLRLQELLRELRQNANLTQEEVAARLERPQSFVSKYESGERRLDILELWDVCQALEISLEAFVKVLEERLT
ncbi:transcriptional regulator [Blastopirellula marina]|uniref:Transcriptional regulator n=1 Tax=Blastopirellula marina TaxID=124 RepID=A0A2S8F089_9BACT|nr:MULTISPECIES: helix-turn-helix transcriptional regulator [Pirellulaceae]PQO25581.1 transcriptional regulator [Blastopirellula marina]RCS42545.1 XRE family transcriptional regulator [Bremerella cremea]